MFATCMPAKIMFVPILNKYEHALILSTSRKVRVYAFDKAQLFTGWKPVLPIDKKSVKCF